MLQRVFFIVCFLVRTTDTATQSQLQSQPHTLHIPHIPPFHQYSVSFIVFFNKDNKYSDHSIFSRRRHYLCVRLLQAPDISPLLLHVASIWKVIRRLCGFVNYLARFMPNLSGIIKPIRQLTRQEVEWQWNTTHHKAFQAIKSTNRHQILIRTH